MDEPTTRRTFRPHRYALVSVAVLALASCGSSSPKAASTSSSPSITTAATATTASATTMAGATTTAGADTTMAGADTTAATDDAPATTNAPPVPAPTNADGSVTVTVTVGTDDFDTTGGKRVVGIKEGSQVTIALTDPSVDEQYHLHGYDIEVNAAKGTAAKISFTADETGQFDLESHVTNKTLLVLYVS
jgi:hypothetical protein